MKCIKCGRPVGASRYCNACGFDNKHIAKALNTADYYYNMVHTARNGKASECVKCGKCEKVCPQHLKIREILEDVAKEFEKLQQSEK